MKPPPPFIFTAGGDGSSGASTPSSDPLTHPVAMSFAFDGAPSSPSVDDYDGDTEEDDDGAMDIEFEEVQSKFLQLDLSDTDMEDSDSDSNFQTDSPPSEDEDEDSLLDGEEGPVSPVPPPSDGGGREGEEALNPYIPPHFASPNYESWLAAQTPNITFRLRIKPLIVGSMIAAHSIRLWYRDFKSRADFLQAIVDEYQLLDVSEISGFVVKERRSKVWVEIGTDEGSWNAVLDRIRNKFADESLTGSAMAVRAELKVFVGGEYELDGIVLEKGTFAVELKDDPDL